jgi:hypothetical protein
MVWGGAEIVIGRVLIRGNGEVDEKMIIVKAVGLIYIPF